MVPDMNQKIFCKASKSFGPSKTLDPKDVMLTRRVETAVSH